MEKNELITKALRKVQYYQQRYAGYHDVCVDMQSYTTGLVLDVTLWVRKEDRTFVMDVQPDGEHIRHYTWQLNEAQELETLQRTFQSMSKFLSDPKKF